MAPQGKIFFVLERLREKVRHGLIFLVLRDYLAKIGIEITPFYYMKETISPDIPACLSDSFCDYDFSFFDPAEIEIISKLPERKFVAEEQPLRLFNTGRKCYGVKCKGEIAAFTWFDFDKCNARFYQTPMKPNEAYLFDMYVLKSFRGKNLAPALRYKSYEVLKEMGRDTCYSITETFNTPSVKFKEKLNAQYVFLGLYVSFFKKYKKYWIVKKYTDRS